MRTESVHSGKFALTYLTSVWHERLLLTRCQCLAVSLEVFVEANNSLEILSTNETRERLPVFDVSRPMLLLTFLGGNHHGFLDSFYVSSRHEGQADFTGSAGQRRRHDYAWCGSTYLSAWALAGCAGAAGGEGESLNLGARSGEDPGCAKGDGCDDAGDNSDEDLKSITLANPGRATESPRCRGSSIAI
jgi:hypothetical protein